MINVQDWVDIQVSQQLGLSLYITITHIYFFCCQNLVNFRTKNNLFLGLIFREVICITLFDFRLKAHNLMDKYGIL